MTETVYHKGWTFRNFPRHLSLEDYESIENEIVESLGRLRKNSCSVFEIIGRSRTHYSLGISDIDYLIFTDEVTEDLKEIFNLKGDGSVKDVVLFHDQLFIPSKLENDSKRFLFKDEEVELKHLFGRNISFTGSNLMENDLRLIEDVIFHNARDISGFLGKDINVRLALHKLKSIKYLSQERIIGGNLSLKKKLDKYFKELNALRDNWFNSNMEANLDQLIRLIGDNFSLYNELLKKLDAYFTKNYLNSEEIGESLFKEPSTPIIFKDSDDYIEETKRMMKITGKIIPVLPKNLSFIVLLHSKGNGIISKHIRKHLSPRQDRSWGGLKRKQDESYLSPDCCDTNKDLLKAVIDRNNFYEEHLKFCKENSLNYGPLISFSLHEETSAKPLKNLKRKVKKLLKKAELDRAFASLNRLR